MKQQAQKIGGVAIALMFVVGAVAPLAPLTASAQTAICNNAVFVRDLTLGSTGSDVIALQTFLETKGTLTIPTGVSKGYFGPLTRAAVAKYQAINTIAPAVGYFGPITRANVNIDCATGTTTGNGGTTTDGDTLSGGEASLEKFELKSEDDAEEGEMAHVATIEFDVEDGDVKINRMDISFEFEGDDSQADDEPWDAFDTITLKMDGKEIAEEDIDDEDDWLRDDSPFVFRLSNLKQVVKKGKTAEIEVYLTANKNVDGADTNDASWKIYVEDDGIRATDGAGIQQYVGNDNETVTFNIDEIGEGEEIKIKSSSSDPDATTLLVDANDKSDWHEAFIFKLEAEENDIDLEELVLKMTTNGTSTYNSVVDDVYIEIDGDESDDFKVTNGNTNAATLTFDLDKDFTIDGDDTVEVVVFVQFKKQDKNYNDKTTTFKVETVSIKGEGKDDVIDTATVSGDTHTLSTSVANVTNVSWKTSESANGATGIIDLFFTVTAEEDDFDVLSAEIMDEVNGTFATATGSVTATSKGKLTRVSGDNVATLGGNAGFTVNEGDTVKFRVRYETTTAGSHEVTVESVAGQELKNDDQLSPTIVLE